jgi:transcriptional regulator with XRE-family HTH domain
MGTYSSRIRKARTLTGLSQAKLALRVGVQRSAVTQWERENGTWPSVAHLAKVALETGVSFEWLATGRGAVAFGNEEFVSAVSLQDFAQDETESRILEVVRRMSAKKRRIACSVLELIAT